MKSTICIKPAVAIALMPTIDEVNPFKAVWTAKGHTLCLGHWIVRYQGGLIVLPPTTSENHMDTFGIFSWLFPDDEDYAEGLLLEEWIEEKADWLVPLFDQYNIPFDSQNVTWLYEALNKSDWRCGSCGGCM